MTNQSLPESGPRCHTRNLGKKLQDVIDHLRADIAKVDDPQAKALFEVSAEVPQSLRTAFEHYESGSERAWRR